MVCHQHKTAPLPIGKSHYIWSNLQPEYDILSPKLYIYGQYGRYGSIFRFFTRIRLQIEIQYLFYIIKKMV